MLIQEGKSRLNAVVGVLSEFPWIEDLGICPGPNGVFESQYVLFVSCDPLCLGSRSGLRRLE